MKTLIAVPLLFVLAVSAFYSPRCLVENLGRLLWLSVILPTAVFAVVLKVVGMDALDGPLKRMGAEVGKGARGLCQLVPEALRAFSKDVRGIYRKLSKRRGSSDRVS